MAERFAILASSGALSTNIKTSQASTRLKNIQDTLFVNNTYLNTSIDEGLVPAPSLRIFPDSRKTGARSAAVLGTPYASSIDQNELEEF